ncbi:glutathione S-transferase family protein [Aquicoccus porphyridii]|uniref:Glutathione S-transferase family protein n=1 Tax=Aquicoccus porphyridii TaxID=1852029 RepID=A0A5A9ZTS5_9RHOB|nr:glutathione S-transferase family protein [Aquicoccus porphyridii]KAA0920763.1 glutathione S-transferase family protein [Aquicoccus porphyridii]RAI56688.1 glutathione S-transferase [Rhodobacteraceae bacterium AsT-22]
MLTVYGRATSSNVQALLWGMEELGLAYERLDYGEVHGGLDTPEFRAMNPHGRIPVLKLGETALFETAAILRYLAGEHGDDAFWPRDPLRRAQVDMWAEWAKHDVARNFTGPVFWRHTRTTPARRDTATIRTNLDRFEAELAKAVPRLLAHDYLCGDDFTLADIQFGHVLFRYFDTDLDRREMPALAAYYARLCDRPAYARTVMVSYDSLRNTF